MSENILNLCIKTKIPITRKGQYCLSFSQNFLRTLRTLSELSQNFLRTLSELSKNSLRSFSELFKNSLRTLRSFSELSQNFLKTYTSTLSTLTPQGSVASSRVVCMSWAMLSRSERMSPRFFVPRTFLQASTDTV